MVASSSTVPHTERSPGNAQARPEDAFTPDRGWRLFPQATEFRPTTPCLTCGRARCPSCRSLVTPQWLPSLALPIQSDLATDRYWAGRPRSDNWQRLEAIDPPRESVGSVCACEQVTGTSARYACSEDHDHECKPSPHRHTSASTSEEKAGQAARADCGSTGDRTGCARSKGAANLFTIPLDDERETACGGIAP